MYQKDGRWTLRAMKIMLKIASNSCDPNYPVLFIDIAQYLPWIKATINGDAQSLANPKPVKKKGGCGQAEFNSFDVSRGSIPWISIGVSRNNFNCIGHLVTKRHLIIGAYCMYPLMFSGSTRDVYFLVNKFNSIITESTAVKAEISRVLLHNEYNDENQENNIAIAVLKKSIQNISPVCLPPPSTSTNDILFDTLFAYGWKSTDGSTAQPTGNANLLSMDIVPKDECDRIFSNILPKNKQSYFCGTYTTSVGPDRDNCDGLF
jgi:hypothetical protein